MIIVVGIESKERNWSVICFEIELSMKLCIFNFMKEWIFFFIKLFCIDWVFIIYYKKRYVILIFVFMFIKFLKYKILYLLFRGIVLYIEYF